MLDEQCLFQAGQWRQLGEAAQPEVVEEMPRGGQQRGFAAAAHLRLQQFDGNSYRLIGDVIRE